MDVGERGVCLRLAESPEQLGPPAAGQLLQGADVEVSVVEERLEPGHRRGQEAAVLADAVAAHRRGVLAHVALQELDDLALRLGLVDRRRADAVGEPAPAVGAGVPRIHPGQRRLALVDRQHRAFGAALQLGVGDDDGDLDDAVGVWNEPGHFEVDPDEVVVVERQGIFGHRVLRGGRILAALPTMRPALH